MGASSCLIKNHASLTLLTSVLDSSSSKSHSVIMHQPFYPDLQEKCWPYHMGSAVLDLFQKIVKATYLAQRLLPWSRSDDTETRQTTHRLLVSKTYLLFIVQCLTHIQCKCKYLEWNDEKITKSTVAPCWRFLLELLCSKTLSQNVADTIVQCNFLMKYHLVDSKHHLPTAFRWQLLLMSMKPVIKKLKTALVPDLQTDHVVSQIFKIPAWKYSSFVQLKPKFEKLPVLTWGTKIEKVPKGKCDDLLHMQGLVNEKDFPMPFLTDWPNTSPTILNRHIVRSLVHQHFKNAVFHMAEASHQGSKLTMYMLTQAAFMELCQARNRIRHYIDLCIPSWMILASTRLRCGQEHLKKLDAIVDDFKDHFPHPLHQWLNDYDDDQCSRLDARLQMHLKALFYPCDFCLILGSLNTSTSNCKRCGQTTCQHECFHCSVLSRGFNHFLDASTHLLATLPTLCSHDAYHVMALTDIL